MLAFGVNGHHVRQLRLGFLLLVAACGSSSPTEIDPLAESYCAACCNPEAGCRAQSCPSVVDRALRAPCPEETRTYYQCVMDSACELDACEVEWEERTVCMKVAPRDEVRARLAVRRPTANLGHRGTGPTRAGHPFPENSISSFLAAIEEGADGVELDAEITKDGEIIVMHDDTIDRTTDCTGCVSEMTLDEIRACRLLDGSGNPTDEAPPSLVEVYGAVGSNVLINVELKVFQEPCASSTTGREQLTRAVLDAVTAVDGQSRTIFSSFDERVVEQIRTQEPGFFAALLSQRPDIALVERAVELELDAIHPFVSVTEEVVQKAREADLQVNVWVADTEELMRQQVDKGSTAIITNEPAVLSALLDELRDTTQ